VELSNTIQPRSAATAQLSSRATRRLLPAPVLPQVGGISTRVPSASSSSTASGLAAHTCANWEGVKVSERGRVSMEALRDG